MTSTLVASDLGVGPFRVRFESSDPATLERLATEFPPHRGPVLPLPPVLIREDECLAPANTGGMKFAPHALLLRLAGAIEDDCAFFHGAAVERDGRAKAFIGPTGSGKTTLALAALRRGWRLLSDETVVFDWRQGCVLPFLRTMNVRPATVRFLSEPGVTKVLPTDLPAASIAGPATLASITLLKPPGASSAEFLFRNSLCAFVTDHRRFFLRIADLFGRLGTPSIAPLRLEGDDERSAAHECIDRLF